jgi:type IX secretion system PorP/SprF family membrane protein
LEVKTRKEYYSFTTVNFHGVTVKRTIVTLLLSIMGWVSFGQDFHFSGFMQNIGYVNPAYPAMLSSGEFGLTYRNQWPGIPATFVTYGASLMLPVRPLRGGIGLNLMNDMQGSGVINQSSISLLYGYLIDAGSSWQVAAGISASYVFRKFDAGELVFRSDILNDLGYAYSPVTLESYAKNYPDFSVGLMARYNNNLTMGISVAHLTQPNHTFSEVAGSSLPLKYTAFVSGTLPVNSNSVTVEPALFYSLQQTNNEIIWGSKFMIRNNIMAGGWIRQNMQFDFEAFIISAGFSWEKYNISYSYDVNLKKINFLSTKMAAHEVTFLYRFEYKNEQQAKRGMKRGRKGSRNAACPAYD